MQNANTKMMQVSSFKLHLCALLHIFITLLLICNNNNNVIFYVYGNMSENDRINAYKQKGYTWLPQKHEYIPPTTEYANFMNKRFRQLSCSFQKQIQGPTLTRLDKYNTYKQLIKATMHTPNLTEYGFGITKAPQHLVDELKTLLHANLNESSSKSNFFPEGKIQVIGSDDKNPNVMIPMNGLNNRILHELRYMHEQWINPPGSNSDSNEEEEEENKNNEYIKLIPNNAYGLRVYKNNSNLLMHYDNAETHIISSILHVDHDPDEEEPWPLVIEGHDGNTYEVILESGDLLFYESSKCLHGRPKPYKGKYYSSLFIHYYPEFCADNKYHNNKRIQRQYWCGKDTMMDRLSSEINLRVPPYWDHIIKNENVEKGIVPANSLCGISDDDYDPLIVNSTQGLNLKESTCGSANKWCPIHYNQTKLIHGPGQYNIIRTAHNKTKPIHTISQSEKDQQQQHKEESSSRRRSGRVHRRIDERSKSSNNNHDEL